MAYACFNCDKKTIIGTQHRHKPGVAGRQHLRRAPRTPKYFRPNLHSAFILAGKTYKKVKLCTKCRRQLKKQGRIKVWKREDSLKQKNIKTPVRPAGGLEQKIITEPIKTELKRPTSKKVVKETEISLEKPKGLKKSSARKPAIKKVKQVTEVAPKETISVEDLVGKKS